MDQQSFWESLGKSACPDDIARDLSIKAIMKRIPENAHLLDLGCGNGFCTFKFVESKAKSIIGLDYSSKSIENANTFLKNFQVIKKTKKLFLNKVQH